MSDSVNIHDGYMNELVAGVIGNVYEQPSLAVQAVIQLEELNITEQEVLAATGIPKAWKVEVANAMRDRKRKEPT